MKTHPTGPRIVVMGVSGSGKSRVGLLVAELLGVPFLDADDLHPAANITKMSSGTPLTDADRWPWLSRVGQELISAPDGLVVACSALRYSYRSALRTHAPDVTFAHLHGTRDQLASRLAARLDHFMPTSLLDTQIRALEPLQPTEAGIVLDIASSPDRLASEVAAWVGTPGAVPGGQSVVDAGVHR